MSDVIAEINASLEQGEPEIAPPAPTPDTPASENAEQAATQMEETRVSTLKELGPKLAQKTRALVKRVTEGAEIADEISLFILQARGVCYRTVTSKHPEYEERPMAEKKVFVPDWDGRTPEYREWFARHFWAVVSEFVVEEIDAEELAKLSKGEDGQPVPEAIVLTAPTGKSIKRAVEYRIEENRPKFVRETRGDSWEDDLKHLGLKLTTKTEDQRNKRNAPTSDSGIPPATIQTENRLKQATKSVKIDAEDPAKTDVSGIVNVAAWLVMHAKALDEATPLEVIDAMPKSELRKVSAYLGSAMGALDAIVKRLPTEK
jgi:hypothetical protein